MRRTLLFAVICVVALAGTASAAGTTARSHGHAAARAKLSGLDTLYLKSSIQTDVAEVAGAKLALTKSHNMMVRKFARGLISDHAGMLKDARSMAAKLGVAAPRSPSPTQAWAGGLLSSLKGSAFDRWYAGGEVAGHEQAIQMTVLEAHSGSNADLRHMARMDLPMLRMHLRMAKALLIGNG